MRWHTCRAPPPVPGRSPRPSPPREAPASRGRASSRARQSAFSTVAFSGASSAALGQGGAPLLGPLPPYREREQHLRAVVGWTGFAAAARIRSRGGGATAFSGRRHLDREGEGMRRVQPQGRFHAPRDSARWALARGSPGERKKQLGAQRLHLGAGHVPRLQGRAPRLESGHCGSGSGPALPRSPGSAAASGRYRAASAASSSGRRPWKAAPKAACAVLRAAPAGERIPRAACRARWRGGNTSRPAMPLWKA